MKNFLKYWLPVIIYLILIFYFSSLPKITIIETIPAFRLKDKLLHIIEYFILSLLLLRAFNQYPKLQKASYLLAVSLSALYGFTDEIHQLFVQGRVFSGFDILTNYIGSSLILLRNKWK